MHPLRTTSISLLVVAALAAAAEAQVLRGGRPDTTIELNGARRDSGRLSDFGRRSSGGIGLTQTRPQGGLRQNISFGYGGSANYVYRLDRAGVVGMRLGGSMAGYGHETMRVPLSYSIGGRIQADVTTTNTIGTLSLGPQLMFPEGFIRPYVNARVGVIWFATTSSVSGIDSDNDNEFSTRNYSDGTPTWAVGTGVHIPLSHRRATVLLDLGVDYFYGGEASYLRKGSIIDLPNAQIQINSFRSETRFVNVTIGARITP